MRDAANLQRPVERLATQENNQASAVSLGLTMTPPPPRPVCPIIQVTLEGNDAFTAWASNPTLQAMETESWPRLLGGATWDPPSRRRLPVFHGTQHYYYETHGSEVFMRHARYVLQRDGPRFQGLEGRVNVNPIAPAGQALPVVWTGFSPLCCFLWAVFRADVIGNVF